MIKTFEELEIELLGKELSFIELDNLMQESGYYSVFDDGVTENIKDSLDVAYSAKDADSGEVVIEFEIISDSGENEEPEHFLLKVTDISSL